MLPPLQVWCTEAAWARAAPEVNLVNLLAQTDDDVDEGVLGCSAGIAALLKAQPSAATLTNTSSTATATVAATTAAAATPAQLPLPSEAGSEHASTFTAGFSSAARKQQQPGTNNSSSRRQQQLYVMADGATASLVEDADAEEAAALCMRPLREQVGSSVLALRGVLCCVVSCAVVLRDLGVAAETGGGRLHFTACHAIVLCNFPSAAEVP